MIDRRIHYYLALDTETANNMEFPLVYDIGGVVTDKQGNIYEKFSFVIRDIFVYEREMMRSAYYGDKIPEYVKDIQQGIRQMISFYEARQHILNLMRNYGITEVAAYNANFDRNALDTTQRWLTKSRYRYFFPYGTKFICIWNMACQTICQRATYKYFCEENNFTCNRKEAPNAKNYSTSAETVYRYLIMSPKYLEEHKGYDDVLIEIAILRACFRSHKAMPYGKGIRRNCWMDVKRVV